VHISLGRGPKEYVIEVADDGVGLPPGTAQAPSLGLEIVTTLIKDDLQGQLEFNTTANGTQVIIRLPHGETTSDE
jgi:two-component sensor histidine kinase